MNANPIARRSAQEVITTTTDNGPARRSSEGTRLATMNNRLPANELSNPAPDGWKRSKKISRRVQQIRKTPTTEIQNVIMPHQIRCARNCFERPSERRSDRSKSETPTYKSSP